MTLNDIALLWIALAVALFPLMLLVRAPYGRHVREGTGPHVSHRAAWIAMEAVSPLVFAGFFLAGPGEKTAPMWVFLVLWIAHYLHRGFYFPLRQRSSVATMPLAIAAGAVAFNTINGWLNGAYLGTLAEPYPPSWMGDWRFLSGLAVMAAGAAINVWADHRLIRLRAPGDTRYHIPHGGLFRLVSCPNHLGEIVEWTGFAIACWSLPALSFAVWTAANLIPRSLGHHAWYRERFPDYPGDRKAVIPYIL